MKLSSIVNFLFEAAALKRLQRTGWQILGDNKETIAEHVYLVCIISFILAEKLNANLEKVLLVALFHDLEEARTGDVYNLADLYTKVDKNKAVSDAFSNLPQSAKISKLLAEYGERKTLESKIVKDADTLSLCLELKQLIEKGNLNAKEWLTANIESLKLAEAKKIGREIENSNSQNWWQKERKKLHRMMKG